MLFYPHFRPAGGLDGPRQRDRSLCHRKRYFLSKPPCGVASAARRSLLSLVIASSIILSSRAERNVPSGYGDLACSGMANREKRDCFAGNSVIARNEAISVYWAGKQRKERLLRRLAITKTQQAHNSEKRDCRAALAMTRCVIARNEAISPFTRRRTEKREIATLRSQ